MHTYAHIQYLLSFIVILISLGIHNYFGFLGEIYAKYCYPTSSTRGHGSQPQWCCFAQDNQLVGGRRPALWAHSLLCPRHTFFLHFNFVRGSISVVQARQSKHCSLCNLPYRIVA